MMRWVGVGDEEYFTTTYKITTTTTKSCTIYINSGTSF